jgi:hypothetical protein
MRASDELLHSVAEWVTDIGTRAAQLPSKAARARHFLPTGTGRLSKKRVGLEWMNPAR